MVHKTVAGILPDEWRGSLIKHVCKVVRGSSPRPAGSPLYFNGNFLPWATVADLTSSDDMYLKSTKSMLTEAGSERTRITDPGTLMLTNSGATLGVPKISSIRCGANDGIAMLLDLDGIATEFAYYYLYSKTQYFRDVIAPGVGQPNLNTELIGDFPIPVPPLPEQKKIAQILSTWDKAITTTEQLLANSQQQKKALMQQLLTGKKRLLDKNGDRFSGEWKDIRLKSVLREVKTRNKDNSIDRVLSVTNHSGFVLPEDQFSKRVASDDVSNYKVVKKGEYGYNPSRLNVGSFARLDSYEEGLLSPMYVVFSVNEKILNSDYFMNWMSSNEAKQRISGSTQGSVRDSVGFDSLCGFPFKLPPMAEQQKIAAVLSTTDQEISALQQKLDTLKQEKKALMQQLLTGKRRVTIEKKELIK